MTGSNLLPTISSSLIKATGLSFIENAPGTNSILEKLSFLLRYTERGSGDVQLNQEWMVLKTFLELQRIQSPDRFAYMIQEEKSVPGEFVPRCHLFSLLHEEFLKTMEKFEGLVTFSLDIAAFSPLKVELRITTEHDERTIQW